MIRQSTSRILASTIACVVLVGLTWAPAAVGDDDGFKLWVDPVSLWIIDKDQDTNSSKFQEYLDLTSGLWASMKIYGEGADGDRTLALRLNAIGRDHARYQLDYGLAGRYSFELDYNKIPHRFGNDATLLWSQTSANSFELPDPVQQALLDAVIANPVNHDFLSGLLAPYYATAGAIDLGLQRNRTRMRFDLGKLGKMAWAFEYQNENRDGNRPMGASFGFFNVNEIPEPVQYNTTSLEVSGERSFETGGLRFGYRYSGFENDLGFVTWDNPYRSFDSTDSRAYLGPNLTTNGPSQGRSSLPPSNTADLFFIEGRGKLGAWWYNGGVSYNIMKQNEAVQPFTINTAIFGVDERTGRTFNAAGFSGMPILNADLDVKVLKLAGNAGTDLGENWDLTFRMRSYDYDNQSTRVQFPGYVRLDSVWEPYALRTVPYDYAKDNYSVELGWEAGDSTRLALAYLVESWDRSFREIEKSDEDTIKLSLDSRPGDKVSFRASWATGDRSTSEYDVEAQEVFFVDPPGINNQPDLRKYDEAERDVDDYDAQLQYFSDGGWNVSFGLSGRDEDYGKSRFGLVGDDSMAYNFEFAYAPGADFNAYLFGHFADHDVYQQGRQSGGSISTNPLDDWNLLLVEETTTWGAGMTSKRDNGWTLDGAVHISNSDGEADFTTPAGGRTAVDFDNYEDIELMQVWVRGDYEVNANCSASLLYMYEDYSIDSFILSGVVPYLPASILLAPNDGDYKAHLFGVNVRFVF